jgi:dipeptidyl aminopeptidase/acylaminoacyl peptidase
MVLRKFALLTGLSLVCATALAKQPPAENPAGPQDDAAAFGALESIRTASLSSDGKRLVYVGADGPAGTVAVVVDLDTGFAKQVARADGNPFNLMSCDWSAANRIVCGLFGQDEFQSVQLPLFRTLAMDADGKNQLYLGQKDTADQMGMRLSDGKVVDWLNGVDGTVLMTRSYMPEQTTGKLLARKEEGLGVDLIDTRTGKVQLLERPGRDVVEYLSDGAGNIRVMTTANVVDSLNIPAARQVSAGTYRVDRRASDDAGSLPNRMPLPANSITTRYIQSSQRGVNNHFYRLSNDRFWRPLGSYTFDGSTGRGGRGMTPLAIDPLANSAYVLQTLNGRDALYRIALDGSLSRELVFANKDVDVDGVARVGRGGRVIGVSYATDRRVVEYFDPDYKKVHAMLASALPKLSLIDFMGASADEQQLVIRASSDVEPGSWYVYDRARKSLGLITAERPALAGRALSPVRAITYPAGDGTLIPAYLTLPPGVEDPKNLPAIVMPHGGPNERDRWGFEWQAQYFANHGFVVLQPNFRGSAGYGEEWFANNGFRSWQIAVGDVCDGARWLLSQGLADSSRLAVFGWSYGGYAALQANVLDPDLFKAVIAVAPISDLALLKNRSRKFSNAFVEADYIGSGRHIKEGSPAQNPKFFKAPVLLFHGDADLNVDVSQSRRMDRELRQAGKSSMLIEYPGLTHSLNDGTARADMLRRSEEFLRANLKIENQ